MMTGVARTDVLNSHLTNSTNYSDHAAGNVNIHQQSFQNEINAGYLGESFNKTQISRASANYNADL